jgi:hypothetical protein
VFSTVKLSNILLLVELSLIFFIFYLILKDNTLWSKLTVAAIILTIIFWVYQNIVLDKIDTYGGFYTGGMTLIIIVFSLAFFYHQLNKPENLFVYSFSAFWMVIAILLYKASTFFLFLYTNSLTQIEKANFYLFNSFFYLLQNLLFAISFLIPDKNKRST